MNEQIIDSNEISTATSVDAVLGVKAYAFDDQETIVPINVAPEGKKARIMRHKLGRPSGEQLIRREQESTYETEEVAKNEDVIRANDDRANANLWDAVVIEVQGYNFDDGVDPKEFRTLTAEQKALIPVQHKVAGARGLYQTSAELEYDEDEESFRIGANAEVTVKQEIGGDPADFVLTYKLREPSEKTRRDYRENAMQVRNVRGARRARSKVVSNLRAAVTAFDELFVSVSGGTFEGKPTETITDEVTRKRLAASIDPIFKRLVVSTAMTAQDASLLD